MRPHLLQFAISGGLAVAGCGLLSGAASATQIYVSNMSLANGYEMATFQPNPKLPAGSWGGGTEYTGQQDLTANLGTTDTPAAHFNVFAWCIDVFHDINIGGNSIVYTLGPITVPDAGTIQKVAAWGNQHLAGGPNALISAAAQAEIWDLEYNMQIVPGSNPALETEVATLNALLPSLPGAGGSTLAGYAGNGSIAQTLYTSNNVPEPASATILGLGFLTAGAIRLRKRRQVRV